MNIKFMGLDRENGLLVKMNFSTESLCFTENQLNLDDVNKDWTFRTMRLGGGKGYERVKALIEVIKDAIAYEYDPYTDQLMRALFYLLRTLSGDECTYEHIEFEIIQTKLS